MASCSYIKQQHEVMKMKLAIEVSKVQKNVITVFKKQLAHYLITHKKDYFKSLSDKSPDSIFKHLMQLPVTTGFFKRDPGLERARTFVIEITGEHDNARHLVESICHKYLNKDDAKGLGSSTHLRESIEQAFIEIYDISVTTAEVSAEQGERMRRNPDFPYSDEEIARGLLHDKVVNKIKSLVASNVPLEESPSFKNNFAYQASKT